MALRDQLQQALGEAYTLERELGGGGMSRVFVAEERALGRKVVVKVLPAELSDGVNIERFKREIQLVARLQHAHIVPILAAGEAGGVPWYTMPFVDGESLRARLQHGDAMPISETVSVLRDVARALAYAHEHGVVHRDIKPDNVMLSGGSAVVVDFGIAKAISAARTELDHAALTYAGTSLGTPAYMAPEQATGDPGVDHRADLYAFGCTAYEMLAGRPPFVAKTSQQLFAAHMVDAPDPVGTRRTDTPPELAALVMRCLEKDPAARPQSAAEVAHVLDTVAHTAAPATLLASAGTMKRALALYLAAFVAVGMLAKAAIVVIGLPDWVFPGSLVVMALQLPVILVTGYVQRIRLRSQTATPAFTPGGTSVPVAHGAIATMALKASPHVSWRRATAGAAWALGAFMLLVGAFMTLRALGIGPAGSLLVSGKLSNRDRILVADFKATGADTVLSGVLAEAMRSSLGESRAVRIVPTSAVVAALTRMARPVNSRVDDALAQEIATREGIKGIITGELTAIGGGYLVTVRLLGATTGDVLASFPQSAKSASDLIPAIDNLGRKLRGKIGESLRAVQNAPELAKVTTTSLTALRKYTEGARAHDVEMAYERAIPLFNEAIALDSNFAMAYRKLAMSLFVSGDPGLGALLDKAYARRDHFGEGERLAVMAEYYRAGSHQDRAKALAAYQELLRAYPEVAATFGANNMGVLYLTRREYWRAESLFAIAIQTNPENVFSYQSIVPAQVAQGKFRDARRSAERQRALPAIASVADEAEANVLYNMGMLDSARIVFARRLAAKNPRDVASGEFDLAEFSALNGRLRDMAAHFASMHQVVGDPYANVNESRNHFFPPATWWILDRKDEANRRLDALLAGMPPAERRTYEVATWHAWAGRADRAKAVFSLADSAATDTVLRRVRAPERHDALGWIALAEGRYTDAVSEFREADRLPDGPNGDCPICQDHAIGLAFDRAGKADSAIAVFEHFVTTPYYNRLSYADWLYLPWITRRLGELYEAKNDPGKAIGYYQRFVELWKDADPELQPQVAQVRERLRRLTAARGGKG
jgi:tetratricopeptide (TPR) repeat protein/tRNA A-37 threonylcarbamoyl transferase component Bud32